MNKKSSGIIELVKLDFNLEENQFQPVENKLSVIREELEKIISFLLEKDFERLLNAMYRLDVSEEEFKEVINGTFGNDVSGKLADLVITRELKKMETRAMFRQ